MEPPPLEITPEQCAIERTLQHIRDQLAIYDSAIAAGQPVPASFSAHLEPMARQLDLEWFSLDEATYTEEAMLEHIEALRKYERDLRLLESLPQQIWLFKRLQEAERNLWIVHQLVWDARQEIDAAALS
ncbi:hypothetical protein VE00_00648 [Pseudogymnoascus sp. WSF 3629]|jgi:hypothetical protein|nr:hypothetical protein VE00_00648 [Pseudogymnoascus sp. WSF 3629]